VKRSLNRFNVVSELRRDKVTAVGENINVFWKLKIKSCY
jgi:hypothetical protein